MQPGEQLAKIESIYAAASRYQDNGRVETTVEGRVEETPFMIMYERDALFHFSYSAPQAVDPAHKSGAHLAWTPGKGFVRRTDADGNVTTEMIESLALGITRLAGASAGAAMTVPAMLLLMPDQDSVPRITRLSEAVFEADEEIAGVPCMVIAGTHAVFGHVRLAIGKSDSLIRKIERRGAIEAIEYHDLPTLGQAVKRMRAAPRRFNISSGAPWESVVGYSRAVRIGNHIWISGTTATDENGQVVSPGDAAAQMYYALQIIERALKEAGATLADVVRTRTFVTDISQWEAIGRVHGEFFGEVRPAATMVEVSKLIDPAHMIEIEVDAFLVE
jgi:enamine deaminase RidA (YjgF/YER057c/UK114 family)